MLATFATLDIGAPQIVVILASIFAVLVGVAIVVFEVAMFVSAVRNPRLTSDTRVLWILGMLFVHPFVAIAYYIVEYKKIAR